MVYTHFLLYNIGCMAERLKSEILEQEKMVDLVCGVTQSGQTAGIYIM